MKQRLKQALIRRSLEKRRLTTPFNEEQAERFTLPPDADDSQNNSYYFSAHDQKGNSLLFRHAQRSVKKTEVWFAFKDADGNACINDQQLFITDAPSRVNCVEPGKTWAFSYHGQVRHLKTNKVFNASFEGAFSAAGPIFEFGHDVDANVLAGAIAREKWSKAFFADLRNNDQVHYEQPGVITGELVLDGERIPYDMTAMRDHSFGKRDWGYMNKHFWLMALFEDGSSLNANMVSYPALKLQTGYYETDGKVICAKAARIIENVQKPHTVPEAFTYEAVLLDGRTLTVSCRREEVFVFPFDNGAYTIYEGIGSFELGNVKGRGILEFGWNGDPKRCIEG